MSLEKWKDQYKYAKTEKGKAARQRFHYKKNIEQIEAVEKRFIDNIERMRESRENKAVESFLKVDYYARIAAIKRGLFLTNHKSEWL